MSPKVGMMLVCLCLQAKEALRHAYFDDLDKETVDQLENPDISNSRDC